MQWAITVIWIFNLVSSSTIFFGLDFVLGHTLFSIKFSCSCPWLLFFLILIDLIQKKKKIWYTMMTFVTRPIRH